MMHHPLFSVVIPAFNRAATLRETLESVVQQRCRDFECIVVDDGSQDATCRVAEQFNFVRLIRQPNSGPGAARNHGVLHSRGRYIAFLDSDDLWFPWSLAVIAQAIESSAFPAIVSASILEFSSNDVLANLCQTESQTQLYNDFLLAQSESDCFVGAGMTIVRRDVFDRVGGYTQKITNCEDHDFMLRAGLEHGFVRVVSPVILAWRRHDGSTTRQLERTIAGVRFLIESEKRGDYPGGTERARQRQSFITARTRPVILECAKLNRRRESLQLFMEILRWNVRLMRWRFLAAYMLGILGVEIRSRAVRSSDHCGSC